MVNRGASRGCLTCRGRKVRCDEGKPHCKECQRLGYTCGGYGRKARQVRFKDETNRFSGDSVRPAKKRRIAPEVSSSSTTPTPTDVESTSAPESWSDYSITSSPQPHQQDLAVTFFLTYVTTIGRSIESTRGFLEFCSPVFASEGKDSALSAAVDAIAMQTWQRLRHPAAAIPLRLELKHKAIRRLQKAIDDPEERKSDATVMATLLLQLSETLSAMHGQQKAQNTHRDGALALLLQRSDVAKHSQYYGGFLANLLHAKVSLSVKQPATTDLKELNWLRQLVGWVAPINASTQLDFIGVSVAKLQQSFLAAFSPGGDRSPSSLTQVAELVNILDEQIEIWLDMVPDLWYRRSILSDTLDASITSYHGTCDVYPSIQIATIWNTWRIYRLIRVQVRLELDAARDPKATSAREFAAWPDSPARGSKMEPREEARTLIDLICHSIPFYLGNRSHRTNFYDMDDASIVFPSLHDMPSDDEASVSYRASTHYVPKADHSRNVLLQGHLHLISILSHLVGLINAGPSFVIEQALRDDQKLFLAEQFTRCMVLSGLLKKAPSIEHRSEDGSSSPEEVQAKIIQVAASAQKVRQKMWTMTSF